MPAPNLLNTLLKLGLALAKHHIKNVIGDDALEVIADKLTDVGGEKVQAKVDFIFSSKEGQKELIKAAKAADEKFRQECKDNDLRELFTMEYGSLQSVQEAIAKLPEALDDEILRETLIIAFRNDAPKRISDEKINEGVNLYIECLQSALIPVKDFGMRIIRNALIEIGEDVKEIKDDVKYLLGQKNLNLHPRKLLKPFALEIPSWFQDPSFQNFDSYQNENKEILLESLATELAEGKPKRFAIIGKSGCGKTVAMSAIMRFLSSRADKVIPCVYVPLGGYVQSLPRTIKSIVGWQDVPDDRVVPELENLGAILLLDALNEVPGLQRDQCRNEIKTLMSSYQNGVVVSYPSIDHIQFGFGYPTYEIYPMNEEQIRKIIIGYFKSLGEGEKADWFLDRFAPLGKFSSDFLQLAELPINLQFLLELGSEPKVDVISVRDLYGQVLDRRFKQLLKQEKKGKFPIDVMKECLADLAIQSLTNDSGSHMQKTFAKMVFSRKLSTVEASEILTEIIRSGLLNEIGDSVQWFHTSLRDYLAGYSLYVLASTAFPLDEFEIDSQVWNGAVAYAVGLSTTPAEDQTLDDLRKRSRIFNEFLNRKPAFELVRSVIQEYHHSIIVGDSPDRGGTESDFQTLNWGDRFITAYNQFMSILKNENCTLNKNLPKPHGLKLFTSASGRFCALVFSDNKGIQFEDLTRFDDQVIESIRSVKPCIGFCMHGYLFPAVDPEVIAYSQLITWLNFWAHEDSKHYQVWLRDLPSFSIFTPNEWVDWQTKEAPDFNKNGEKRQNNITFMWQELYAPLTFCVDPFVSPVMRTLYTTRTGSLVFTRKPASHISLMLLLSESLKSFTVDLGTHVHIPLPAIHLNRDYSVENISFSYTKGGPSISLMHLRG